MSTKTQYAIIATKRLTTTKVETIIEFTTSLDELKSWSDLLLACNYSIITKNILTDEILNLITTKNPT
jgi:hypothetical protein